jgi:hypothetical protein
MVQNEMIHEELIANCVNAVGKVILGHQDSFSLDDNLLRLFGGPKIQNFNKHKFRIIHRWNLI